MATQDSGFNLELSRRKLLAAAGIGGGAAAAVSLIGTGEADAAPAARLSFDPVATPPVAGLHLQFGADASSEMVVSWHTLQAVRRPRVLLGRLDGKLEQTVGADGISYTDAVHHLGEYRGMPLTVRMGAAEDRQGAARIKTQVHALIEDTT